jgi:3-hydroxy-9,10-secoandrosta-1,3,5(10)-triene-9,17-dione monooxygenase reductase component
VSRKLRHAFGHFATGVTVITCRDAAGVPVGMTANSFSSLSLDPPLVLWSLAKTSSNYAAFVAAPHFCVHVLGEEQQALAGQFAVKDADRFAGVTVSNGQGEVPVIVGSHAHFECATHALYDGGDHTIIVGRVLETHTAEAVPLLFYGGKFAKVAAVG